MAFLTGFQVILVSFLEDALSLLGGILITMLLANFVKDTSKKESLTLASVSDETYNILVSYK